MSAPGATPRQVELRLAIAPATQVGWMWVTTVPVVLRRTGTWPARSPVFDTLWYSTTATRTPLPWSPLPPVQSAPNAGPADDMNVRHSCSSPRLSTSARAATASTPVDGMSTKTSGAEVLTYATVPPLATTSASSVAAADAYVARRASQSSARMARACSSVVGSGRPPSHWTSGCAASTAASASVGSASSQTATRSIRPVRASRTAATSGASALRSRVESAAILAATASSSTSTEPSRPAADRYSLWTRPVRASRNLPAHMPSAAGT